MQKINDEQKEKRDIDKELRELNDLLHTLIHEWESCDAESEQSYTLMRRQMNENNITKRGI